VPSRRTVAAQLASLAVAVAAPAALRGPARAAPAPAPRHPGWAEAVAIVTSLARTARWLADVAGWTRVWRGPTPPGVLALWGLPAGARGEEWLMGNPGDSFGRVRLVQLSGAGPQRRIRPAAMPWEPGGLFSLMVRTRDLDAAWARHQALGFDAFSEPYAFTFGGVALRNIVLRGPDGINLAVYERVRPQLEGWPNLTRLSPPFNSMMMVADRARSQRFWEDAGLGLGVLAQGRFTDPAPEMNNFAIPANLVTSAARSYAILAEPGAETGRVELMAFEGLGGRDFSAAARPPNLGLASLRWPVAALPDAATVARVEPYGRVRLSLLRSPDGVIVERMAPA